ncbi:Solute carrier family 2, facilitated glucose transporter member 3 [Cucumispora dikerogammari]|nr:Solute carrier family 2, facilitated glucose transporter member 3 [Cucumispora dikerogammari]
MTINTVSDIKHNTERKKASSLPPLARSILKPSIYQVWYSAIVISLSSFFFGFCLTSNDFFINNFNRSQAVSLSSLMESLFLSINLIGALFGNLIINNFYLDRKMVVILNNLGYALSILIVYLSSLPVLLLFGRFLIGICIGITCSQVPSYLTELSTVSTRGLIGSSHQLFITIGVLAGFIFDANFKKEFNIGLFLIFMFLALHTVSLFFITPTVLGKPSEGLKKLLSLPEARKSLIVSTLFHFTQQASGVNVIVICSSKLLGKMKQSAKNSIYIGLSQVISTIISTGIVEKVGRKPLMIISIGGVCVALALMTFTEFVSVGMYMFMGLFAFGLGPVTWFITGEIVPTEYRNATNQVATSANWFFAFLSVVTQEWLYSVMNKNMFMIYLGFMAVYLVYIVLFFKETKGRTAGFL